MFSPENALWFVKNTMTLLYEGVIDVLYYEIWSFYIGKYFKNRK